MEGLGDHVIPMNPASVRMPKDWLLNQPAAALAD
jgi:hypothetical protein